MKKMTKLVTFQWIRRNHMCIQKKKITRKGMQEMKQTIHIN